MDTVMGNRNGKHQEPFTNEGLPENDDDFLKKQVEHLKVPMPVVRYRVPNEIQYNEAAAYGLVAYKNQNPDSISDLDLARLNFETKYESFLNWYGQYSNTVIKNKKGAPITYPVQDFFDGYAWRKPG